MGDRQVEVAVGVRHQAEQIGGVRLARPHGEHLPAGHLRLVRASGAPSGASPLHRAGDIERFCGGAAWRGRGQVGSPRALVMLFTPAPRRPGQLRLISDVTRLANGVSGFLMFIYVHMRHLSTCQLSQMGPTRTAADQKEGKETIESSAVAASPGGPSGRITEAEQWQSRSGGLLRLRRVREVLSRTRPQHLARRQGLLARCAVRRGLGGRFRRRGNACGASRRLLQHRLLHRHLRLSRPGSGQQRRHNRHLGREHRRQSDRHPGRQLRHHHAPQLRRHQWPEHVRLRRGWRRRRVRPRADGRLAAQRQRGDDHGRMGRQRRHRRRGRRGRGGHLEFRRDHHGADQQRRDHRRPRRLWR